LTGTRGEVPAQPGSQAAARLDSMSVGAMRFLFERVKLVTEPSGASALAALLTGKVVGRGKRIGVTISGGNIGLDGFCQIINQRDA
jgi:threo-3-hydroxy-L-aspartate ammonia-lyase